MQNECVGQTDYKNPDIWAGTGYNDNIVSVFWL